jgi:ectoine hydroxylase-related dioxygenase (phytanoyl-CoA dioxygenase family)
MVSLSPEQKRAWIDEGAIFPLDLFDYEEATTLRKGIDELMKAHSTAITGLTIQLLNSNNVRLATGGPDFFENAARNEILLDYVAEVIGSEVNFLWGDVFYKKPGKFVLSWHTGRTAYPTLKSDGSGRRLFGHCVTAIVALERVSEQNGCVVFVPGSHKFTTAEVQKWQRSDPRKPETHFVVPPGYCATARPIELEIGQVALLSEAAIHGSGANLSQHVRPSLSLRYFSTQVMLDPDKLASGRYRPIRVR